MSDYTAISRTNYFRVTDEEKYQQLFNALKKKNPAIEDFAEPKNHNEKRLHGFGMDGEIQFFNDDVSGATTFDFMEELQKILPDGEVFVSMEIGHEKLCYLTGVAQIVNNKEIRSVDLEDQILQSLRQISGNKNFSTQLFY